MTKVRKGPKCASIGLAHEALTEILAGICEPGPDGRRPPECPADRGRVGGAPSSVATTAH